MKIRFYDVNGYKFKNREDALKFRDMYYFKERFLYRNENPSVYHYNGVREEIIEIETFDYIYAEIKDFGYSSAITILPRLQNQEHDDFKLGDLKEFYHIEKFNDKNRDLKSKVSYLEAENAFIVKMFIPVKYAKTITKDIIKDRLIKRVKQFRNVYYSVQGDKKKKIEDEKNKYYKELENLLKNKDNASTYLNLFKTITTEYFKENNHTDKEITKFSQKLFNLFHDSIISNEDFSNLVIKLMKFK